MHVKVSDSGSMVGVMKFTDSNDSKLYYQYCNRTSGMYLNCIGA